MNLSELSPTRRADLDVDDALIRRALRSGELVTTRRGVLVGGHRVASAVDHRDKHLRLRRSRSPQRRPGRRTPAWERLHWVTGSLGWVEIRSASVSTEAEEAVGAMTR